MSDDRGAIISGPALPTHPRFPMGRGDEGWDGAPFSCRRRTPYLGVLGDPDPSHGFQSVELKSVPEAPKERSSVYREADALARAFLSGIARTGLTVGGLILVIAGVAIAPLPGPLGLPLTVVGLMMVLRGSFRAKREFVRLQNRHPKFVRPLRRLLRRDPEIIPFAWQQSLRVERLVLPKRYRFLVRTRKKMKGRRRTPD